MAKSLTVSIITILVFLSAIAIASATMPARPDDVLWSKTFGEGNNFSFASVARVPDGGYIMVGHAGGRGYRDYLDAPGQGYIARVDADGGEIWDREYDAGYSPYFVEPVAVPDGNFWVAGRDLCIDAEQGILLKINANGDLLFNRTLPGDGNTNYSTIVDALLSPDGSLVVAGKSWKINTSTNLSQAFNFVTKIDSGGNVLWSRTYDTPTNDGIDAIDQASGDGYVLAGSCSYRAYIIRLDGNGNKIWDATFDGTGVEDASAICLADNGYVLAIQMESLGSGYLLKVDQNGTVVWRQDVNATPTDIIRSSDGGYVTVGYVAGPFLSSRGFIAKVNRDGVMELERTLGANGESLYSVIEAADESYVCAGTTHPENKNYAQGWLIAVGNTKGPGITPEGNCCCWPALILPTVAVSIVALRRRRPA